MFSVAGEGLCVGRDSGEPVTGDYPGDHPHIFTGGTIKRVAVDVSGEPYVNLEREALAMLVRDIITVNGLFANNAIRSWVARRAGACC
jgi:arylsulfatase